MMAPIHGPAKVILHLPTDSYLTEAMIDKMILGVPSLQPGLLLYGHDVQTGELCSVGTILRTRREGRGICQEATIKAGVVVDSFFMEYRRVDVVP